MAQFNYRVTDPDVMAANKGHFPPVTLLKWKISSVHGLK